MLQLLSQPAPILAPRLVLRALDADDAAALLALYRDADVMRYWNHAPWPGLEAAQAAVAEAQEEYASGAALQLAVALRTTGELIGHCAMYGMARGRRRASVGYLLAPAHWGRGYGREALAALLAHGFSALGMLRIEAEVDPANSASAALLARLGFRRSMLIRRRWELPGGTREVDLHVLRVGWFRPA